PFKCEHRKGDVQARLVQNVHQHPYQRAHYNDCGAQVQEIAPHPERAACPDERAFRTCKDAGSRKESKRESVRCRHQTGTPLPLEIIPEGTTDGAPETTRTSDQRFRKSHALWTPRVIGDPAKSVTRGANRRYPTRARGGRRAGAAPSPAPRGNALPGCRGST